MNIDIDVKDINQVERIDALTPEQEAALPKITQKWISIGLSTARADREAAEDAIREMYRNCNLKEPEEIFWSPSPKAMLMKRALMKEFGRERAAELEKQELTPEIWGQIKEEFHSSVWGCSYGSQDAGWLAFYWAFRLFGLVEQTKDLSGLWKLAQNCGWIYPCETICFASERPSVIHLNERNVLHCENGPAIAYPDGWGIYSWNGVRVPQRWIEDRDNLDPLEVIKVRNVELRAAGCHIVGWPKMVEHLDRKIIDGDPDSDMGALIELTLPGLPEAGRFLQAKCPRNGTIVEGVPKVSPYDNEEINTALRAQAWRVALPNYLYQHPPVRT